MIRMMKQEPSNVRLKSIALPVEHGSWAFLLEPILLALLLTPSPAAFWLSVAALGVFLIHQPMKIALKDHLKGKRYPRTPWAERFAGLYAALGISAGIFVLLTAQGPFWIPIVLAVPFASLQMLYAARGQGREILPEILGAIALGAVLPAAALANTWAVGPALVLWLIPAVRAITSIYYVRVRLRQERGEPAPVARVVEAHALALAFFTGLAILRWIHWLVPVAMVLLLVRAWYGLSSYHLIVPAKVVGFQEMGYGLLTVLLVAISYRLF